VRRRIAGHRSYHFRYDATEDMSFDFSMLCEVGQPWVPVFERLIAEQNLDLVTTDIPERPWVITVERSAAAKHIPNLPKKQK